MAARATPVVERMRAASRASPVVHADETGLRQDGTNGYAWTFSTATERSFVRGTREKAVPAEMLGAGFAGVLVSDFYAAYTHYDGRHQYCWAHLLRDVHELVTAHPRDAGARGWAAVAHALFARATAFGSDDPGARCRAAQAFAREPAALCAPYLPSPAPAPPVPPQWALCQRIDRHLADLFAFVEDPAVPATTNAAERSLRHPAVSRTISGGPRSETGSPTKMTLASVFGTWRAQGLDPFAECRRLLASPQT